MISIAILSLKQAVVASVADCRYLFTMVNSFLEERGREPLFKVQLVGLTPEVRYLDGAISIRNDALLSDPGNYQLIIIPSLSGIMTSAIMANKEYIPWINTQYKEGAELASLCSGAFMLAFSGLLKGKQCTTHWSYANELRFFYPAVEVVDEKVITDQHGLYSSGGSTAYWNLLIYLVEKYAGREMAIYAAKYFVVDIDKNRQSPFIVFHGLKDHHDESVKEVQSYIEQNYKDKLTVDQLALRFSMSRRNFERRFKKATRHTVAEYIQKVKIEGAKKQLESGRKSINEVMVDIGYGDIQSFRDNFKRITGVTPVEYRNKYNRE